MVSTIESDTSRRLKIIAIIFLILTTFLWGSSFIITRNIVQEIPVFLYIGIRFSFALLGYVPFLKHFRKINKKVIIYGFITGLLYFLSIITQALGLQTTSAGKAAFITGLSTIMVPFIMRLGYKTPLKKRIWLAATLATIGIGVLFLEGVTGVLIGDLLVLACAVFYAFFIIKNDEYVKLVDVYLYSMIQLIVIVILSFGGSLIFNETHDSTSLNMGFWIAIIYMGLIVATLTFIFQNWAQKHVDAAKTAIIFALEPLFAVLFASYLIGDETLSLLGWIGCGIIFIAIIITIIKIKENNENSL